MSKLPTWLAHIEKRTELAIAVCFIFPIIQAFTIFPTDILVAMLVSFVAIRKGMKEASVLAFVFSLAKVALITQGFSSPVGIVLIVLVVGSSYVLSKTRSFSLMVELLSLLLMLIVVGIHLYIPDVADHWLAFLQTVISSDALESGQFTEELLIQISLVLTGLYSFFIGILTIVTCYVGMCLDAISRSKMNILKDNQVYVTSIFALGILVLSWSLAWLGNQVLIDIAILSAIPFMISGFVRLNRLFQGKGKQPMVAQVALVLMALMFIQYAILVLIGVGLFEAISNVQSRLFKRSSS